MSKTTDQKIGCFCNYLEKKGLSWSEGKSIEDENIFITEWNDLPDNCSDWMESLGYEVWWSDESIQCENCYRWIYTQPGYYGDIPEYKILPDHVTCFKCISDDIKKNGMLSDYFEFFIDNDFASLNNDIIPESILKWWGFKKAFEYPLESGMHHGQTDTPESVKHVYMRDNDMDVMPTYLFYVDSIGQFDVKFDLWIKTDDN